MTKPTLTPDECLDAAHFARCSLTRRQRPDVLRSLVRVYGPEHTRQLSAIVQQASRDQRVRHMDDRWDDAMTSGRRSLEALRGLGMAAGGAS